MHPDTLVQLKFLPDRRNNGPETAIRVLSFSINWKYQSSALGLYDWTVSQPRKLFFWGTNTAHLSHERREVKTSTLPTPRLVFQSLGT